MRGISSVYLMPYSRLARAGTHLGEHSLGEHDQEASLSTSSITCGVFRQHAVKVMQGNIRESVGMQGRSISKLGIERDE